MFGHQEPDQNNDEHAFQGDTPMVSDNLTQDPPISPSSDTITESDTNSGDSTGSYIMTEPEHSLVTTDDNDHTTTDTDSIAADDSKPKISNELMELKQKALQQLSPLVGHLDQTPEEKFRTTMMMIQASDDQSLLNSAYESAKQITDEKTKAQALLDVVNEINYFTQQQEA